MFKFKGISSKEMGVVVEEEDYFLSKASSRYENIDIDGRDGSLFNELGYTNIDISMDIQILNPDKIDDIYNWLNGSGEFEYKGRKTTAFFYNDISLQRMVSIKKANIIFSRSPFWVSTDQNYKTVTDKIVNSGNIYSKPVIRLEKGEYDVVELTIANVRFKYSFHDDNYVEIDCENYEAMCDGMLRNRNLEIGFDFPKLSPGENKITFHSGICVVKVRRFDRWL